MLKRITYTRKDNSYLMLRAIVGIVFLCQGIEIVSIYKSVLNQGTDAIPLGEKVLLFSFGVINILGSLFLLLGFMSRVAGTTLMIFVMAFLFQFNYPIMLESGIQAFIVKSSKELLLVSSCILIVMKGSGNKSVDSWIYKKYYKSRYYGS